MVRLYGLQMRKVSISTRRPVPSAIDRQATISAANGTCSHCGTTGTPLEIRFIVPRSEGGGVDRDNMEAVCPTCHRLLDLAPSEIFFEQYLGKLLASNSDYSQLQSQPLLAGRMRPDILINEASDEGIRKLLIECKSLSVLSDVGAENVLKQFSAYASATPEYQLILAFPGRTTPEARDILTKQGIQIWDIEFIASRFSQQVRSEPDSFYSQLIINSTTRARPEADYLNDIKAIKPGKDDWSQYQKLVGRLLEVLFCPPLESPLGEKSDSDKVNRRDLIFANHSSEGFWAALRQRYNADYILVDAKNGAKVKKSDVLQIANYLKPHGLGQFAIIVGRGGIERSVPAVLKEQWAFHKKMILILDDGDLEEMVLAYGSGREQTKVLSDKIQAFRVGM